MEQLVQWIVGLSYASAGLVYGYLLVLPLASDTTVACLYDETLYWPHIIIIIAMIITVLVTNGLKLNNGKTQFVHLYLLLAGAFFALAAGLVFLLAADVVPAIYLGAVSIGLTLVPGLSYLHIRCTGRYRVTYMSLCTFWYLVGIASSATISAMAFDGEGPLTGTMQQEQREQFHQNVAIALLASSSFTIVLLAVVEMLQREAIVDYKRPLDLDTAIAHDSGKLVARRFHSRLDSFAYFGRSTEQLAAPAAMHFGDNRYRTLWTVYSIATKLVGLLAFYWVLLFLGFQASINLFEQPNAWYCVFWFMAAGALVSTLASPLLPPKVLFLLSSALYVVGLVLCVAFYASDRSALHFGIAKLLYFAFVGCTLPLPSINILELAPFNYNETMLAFGTLLELLGIALLQYFGSLDGTLFGMEEVGPLGIDVRPVESHKGVIASHYVTAIVLGLVLALLVLWHMPGTQWKTLPAIEHKIGGMRSYFAFSRKDLLTAGGAVPRGAAVGEPDPYTATTNGGHAVSKRNEELRYTAYGGAGSHTSYAGSYDSHSPSSDPFQDFELHTEGSQQLHARSANGLENGGALGPAMYNGTHQSLPNQHKMNNINAGLRYAKQQQQQQQFPTSASPMEDHGELEGYIIERGQILQPRALLHDGSHVGSHSSLQPRELQDAPTPPPMPPAGYLTKSLPRVKAVRQSRIPPLIPKPEREEEVVIPGVEYLPNLVPSQFLRQSVQTGTNIFLASAGYSSPNRSSSRDQ
ncbi:uncharacterized protein LOC126580928 [Anopheles aquasalis]|uniref:uncharacterized protein LOC126580928 n=1 Tax=Anopheles aquasalis TaxID=42839 RepID=UPI00215B063B|nr:uncharacterized protein LOC126580928 [Anopheles aquasalis]XP_050100247.1 uncharacterized protein LOC126580928 [Anopheles aquasalis]